MDLDQIVGETADGADYQTTVSPMYANILAEPLRTDHFTFRRASGHEIMLHSTNPDNLAEQDKEHGHAEDKKSISVFYSVWNLMNDVIANSAIALPYSVFN